MTARCAVVAVRRLPAYTVPLYLSLMATSWTSLIAALAGRALVDPRLALDLLRTAWAFRRRRWWAAAPYLPLPDRAYLRWRMLTAYADEGAVPPLDDVVRFARWRRETMGL
jgi:hypothetical protein